MGESDRRGKNSVEGKRVVVVTNPLRGHSGWVADRFTERYRGRRRIFHPLEQGVLHNAVRRTFNTNVLPDLDIGNARTVLSFGADWMSGWVSPTRYASLYGKMRSGQRGFLIHTEPRFSLTAANAALWLPARPGTEADIALAIGRIIVDEGLASDGEISAFMAGLPAGILFGYSPSDVAARSGVSEESIRRAARRFAEMRPSIAFGGGSTAAQTNGSFALTAIYALNHLVSSTSSTGGIVINQEPLLSELSGSGHGEPFSSWEEEVAQWRAGFVDTVIIRGADIVYGMPASIGIRGALGNVPRVIVFGNVTDDTAALADLVLPETTFLEEWGTDVPEPAPGYQTVSFQQPITGTEPGKESELPRSFGDVLLTVMGGIGSDNSMRDVVRRTSDSLFAIGGGSISAPSRDLFFRGVRQRGGWWNISSTSVGGARSVNPFQFDSTARFSDIPASDSGRVFSLIPFESNSLMNGRLAPTPWAQQCPDPLSTVAWVTWAEMNMQDAETMNVKEGDILLIRSTAGEIQAAAYIHPAAPPGVVGVPIGFGSENGGRYAEDRGANVIEILVDMKDEDNGALAWAATRVAVTKLGRRIKMPKFEGNVEAFPREPGVPVLVVAPGETAEEAEEANHKLYQEQFLGRNKSEDEGESEGELEE